MIHEGELKMHTDQIIYERWSLCAFMFWLCIKRWLGMFF